MCVSTNHESEWVTFINQVSDWLNGLKKTMATLNNTYKKLGSQRYIRTEHEGLKKMKGSKLRDWEKIQQAN